MWNKACRSLETDFSAPTSYSGDVLWQHDAPAQESSPAKVQHRAKKKHGPKSKPVRRTFPPPPTATAIYNKVNTSARNYPSFLDDFRKLERQERHRKHVD